MSLVVSKNNHKHLMVIATPIGNLNEINARAINAINNLDVFLCEDTRTTKHLFDLLGINYLNKTFISYHKYNEKTRLQEVLDLLKQHDVGLLSDAGYPCFSDPGYVVVQACIQNNIFVEVINGSNAYVNALVASGYSNQPSTFYGFLDWSKNKDIAKINFPNTILCFYESVHRINATLKIMHDYFGNKDVVVLKELTKLNETHYFGTLKDLQIPADELKGEFVIVLNNIQTTKTTDLNNIADEFIDFDQMYCSSNLKNKLKLFLKVKKTDASSNELYDLIQKKK